MNEVGKVRIKADQNQPVSPKVGGLLKGVQNKRYFRVRGLLRMRASNISVGV